VQYHRVEQEALVTAQLETLVVEEEHFGWSSDNNEGERNMEDDEYAATASKEDKSPQLHWWKVLEWHAEEEEKEVLLASFAYKREEDRERAEIAALSISSSSRKTTSRFSI
jgi:hypothetical protein